MVHIRQPVLRDAEPGIAAESGPETSKPLSFEHTGWLWHNAFLLYDVGTESVWHHQTGRAMAGELRGAALPRLPSVLTTWAAWTAEHPDTLVLPKTLVREGGDTTRDVYAERNASLTVGLGLDVPDAAARLYPLASIAAGNPVHDEIDDTPVVIALDLETNAAYAFDRRVDGETLSFTLTRLEDGRPGLAEQGGTRVWSLVSGRPADGPQSSTLAAVLSSRWDQLAWQRQHPDGVVWNR